MKFYNKIKFNNKGISLVALVVIVIVLLILMRIVISTFSGEDGVLDKTNTSVVKAQIASIEKEANVLFLEEVMSGKNANDISVEYISNKLRDKGYVIVQTECIDTITGISVNPKSVSILPNGNTSIDVTFIGEKKNNYCVVIEGENYVMTKIEKGIKIEKDSTNFSNLLTATSSDKNVVNISNIIDNSIELKAKATSGTAQITVKYKDFSDSCTATITTMPLDTTVSNGDITFETEYGTIDIVWLDKNNNVINNPNSPEGYLTSNNESMRPVVFNESTQEWQQTSNMNNWYNYNQRKWANAMTANDSYFVWIPRYAYRITYYSGYTTDASGNNIPTGNPTGYYDGYGMWKAQTGDVRLVLDSGIETVDYKGNKYIVHPAFETNLDMGGWSNDLAGFWFAKFKMGGLLII